MVNELTNFHVIVAMAAVTIFIRFIGFYVMSHVPFTPFVKAALEALPAAILVSTVVPIAIKTGWVAMLGVCIGMVVRYFTNRDFLALIAGLGVISALRLLGH